MLNWELLTAALDARRGTPMFVQLSEALASDIRSGRLKPGDPLPGTRALATRCGSTGTPIIAGYKELMAQGLVEARRGGGTFVSGQALSTFEDVDRIRAGVAGAHLSGAATASPVAAHLPARSPDGADPLPRGAGRAAVPDRGAVPRVPERPPPPRPEAPQLRRPSRPRGSPPRALHDALL